MIICVKEVPCQNTKRVSQEQGHDIKLYKISVSMPMGVDSSSDRM